MYTKLSKYISYLLRHHPEDLDLKMNVNGWVNAKELVDKIHKTGKYIINIDILKQIVKEDDKQRYSFSNDGLYIRANQGHSIKGIDLQLTPIKPPDVLYHGTSERSIRSIVGSGAILPMKRHHVHLSTDVMTALVVGSRHGDAPIVLCIDAKRMYEDGCMFYKSENNVWLTDNVELKYFSQLKYCDDDGNIVNVGEVRHY